MCHSRRNTGGCCPRRAIGTCGRRRTPVLVTLGKLAYDKYQERKTLRAEEATRSPSPTPEQMEQNANAEILSKAGIAPPGYEDVVGPAEGVKVGEKGVLPTYAETKEDEGELSSDDEDFYEVVDGRRVLDREFEAAQREFVRKWKARKGGVEVEA